MSVNKYNKQTLRFILVAYMCSSIVLMWVVNDQNNIIDDLKSELSSCEEAEPTIIIPKFFGDSTKIPINPQKPTTKTMKEQNLYRIHTQSINTPITKYQF